jgi:MFS-type transporter involved in bile tolerance (Atg22 family)
LRPVVGIGRLPSCSVLPSRPLLPSNLLEAGIDRDRDSEQSLHPMAFQSRKNLIRPLRLLWQAPILHRFSGASACFSCAQGAVFAYYLTFLVQTCHFSLASVGMIFAIFQVSGTLGRLILGWLSDRLGSGRPILCATGFLSAATIAALALSAPDWPFFLHGLLRLVEA